MTAAGSQPSAPHKPTKPTFDWKRWPETERAVDAWAQAARAGNSFANGLARRMTAETSTRFVDWIDHFVLADRPGLEQHLVDLGYERQVGIAYGAIFPVFHHRHGIFPRVAVTDQAGSEVRQVAIKVESAARFSQAHNLGLEILGPPMGPYRVAKVEGAGADVGFAVVERRGYLGFEPFSGDMARRGLMTPHSARDALAAREFWQARRRRFDEDEAGFDYTETVLEKVIDRAGSADLACHLIFEVERDYWEARNRAARVQKYRQDLLGLGWANHDHHTFRCSRQFFPRVMKIFKALGFNLREAFHAGAHAGWGAQVLEHPVSGIVIFADLDLTAEELDSDFAHIPLPNLPRPNTVGLWVALHGESLLEAGMHHLEAQFEFDALREALEVEGGIKTMKPFSDFPFLRQAFTQGEIWPVDRKRADQALAAGWIDAEQHARFLAEGALGSHMENLQRREGYKGFNQQAVSAIITATDPRLQANGAPKG